MKQVRGYIFSRPFMGERVPQHIQNLVIRNYCEKNDLQYLLSATEYAMNGSFLILQQVLDELPTLEGIAAYSLYQLPESSPERKKIYQRILAEGRSFYFAVEGLMLRDKLDCDRIENLWKIRLTLPHCHMFREQK